MAAALMLFSALLAADEAESDPFPGRFREDLDASHDIRQEQFNQIKHYVEQLAGKADVKRAEWFEPDFADIETYTKSLDPLRKRVLERIGFPPPDVASDMKPRWTLVAEDAYAKIYRMWYEVLEGVELYSMLWIPNGLDKPAPLIICQHGGDGSPEVIGGVSAKEGDGSFNYGWMVQKSVEQGYVAWAPSLIFRVGGVEEIEGPGRRALDKRARYVGTSILAIELWKIMRGLDVVLERPEVDASRVGMIGLSYGGCYTLYMAALEPRIDVAVSSCFFNDRTQYAWDDWAYFNVFNEFTDPELCALICPRPLMIEVGQHDTLFDVEPARRQAERAGTYWERLGLAERFVFVDFDGGHEFWGRQAYDFVNRFLKP